MLKNKLMLPILAVIVGVAASAFTMPNHRVSADTLYYFQFSGSSYSAVTLSNGTSPQMIPFCSDLTGNQCDGGFPINQITVTDNGNGTSTWTPSNSPSVTDLKKN